MLGKRVKGSCEGTSYLPNWTLERGNLECFNRRKWLETVWNMETSTVMCCRPPVFFLTCVFKNKVHHKQQIRLELHLNVWLSLRLERFHLTFPTTNVYLKNELPTAENKTWKVPDKQIQELLYNGGFCVYMLSLWIPESSANQAPISDLLMFSRLLHDDCNYALAFSLTL